MRPDLRRRGFTLVEVSLGMALGVVVLLVVFEVLLAGRRGAQTIRTSLEANEATLKTFRRLSRDIRSAREITAPGMAPAGTDFPAFSWTDEDTGNHVLQLQVAQLVLHGPQVVPVYQDVRWWLDDPVEVEGPSGPVRRFKLYRSHSEYKGPGIDAGAPPPQPATIDGAVDTPHLVAEGVVELVFFRVSEDPAAPSPDEGEDNVQVLLKSARIRRRRDGRQALGFSAELRTTIHKRGALP